MEFIQENVSALAATLKVEPEVITKFLTDAAAAEEVKPFAEQLGKLQVFPEDIFNTRIANERTDAATKAARETLGTTYGAVDRRVKEATGVEKLPAEEKDSLAYAERAFREKFSKTTDSEELQRARDDAKAAKDALTSKTTEFDNYKTTVEKEASKARIGSAFAAAAAKLDLADASQVDYLQFKFDQKYSSKLNGETVEYTDRATGELVRDPETGNNPMTSEKLLKLFAPTVSGVSFKKPSAQPSGYKPGPTPTEGSAAMDFTGINSVAELNTELRKRGVVANSDEHSKAYEAFKKARPDLFPTK